jgi:IPT/TIG domain
MSNTPELMKSTQENLVNLLHDKGLACIKDPQQCKALLKDYLTGNPLGSNLIVTALDERIPQALLDSAGDIHFSLTVDRLCKRLTENRGVSEYLAQWAVESWAAALELPINPVVANHAFESKSLPRESTPKSNILLPVIESFEPQIGAPGTKITIRGKNLINVAAVEFGNLRVEKIKARSEDFLEVDVPFGAMAAPLKLIAEIYSSESLVTFQPEKRKIVTKQTDTRDQIGIFRKARTVVNRWWSIKLDYLRFLNRKK